METTWIILLLVSTPAPADSLFSSLEQAARDIGLYMSSDKTEFMCFNQNGVISINGKLQYLI